MTEKTEEQNQEKKSAKKKQNFFTKFVILVALIFFGYLGAKYWQIQREKEAQAKAEVEKTDNVDSEIFDLSEEYKEQQKQQDLSDLTVNEMKEKGAEFIYQMLLKNQTQIEDLRQQIQVMKGEIVKYKNNEKIGKMILVYVDLRQKIYAGKNYSEEIKNFEILAAFDDKLPAKITQLEALLPNFMIQEKLQKQFSALIPELITTKNNADQKTGLVAKVRHNLAKLIIIRKIDGKNPEEIDSVIVKIEKSLLEGNFQEALDSALSLDQNYHEILKDFLITLSVAVDVQKLDQEILNYIKSLT